MRNLNPTKRANVVIGVQSLYLIVLAITIGVRAYRWSDFGTVFLTMLVLSGLTIGGSFLWGRSLGRSDRSIPLYQWYLIQLPSTLLFLFAMFIVLTARYQVD
jgi:hypothetical protein